MRKDFNDDVMVARSLSAVFQISALLCAGTSRSESPKMARTCPTFPRSSKDLEAKPQSKSRHPAAFLTCLEFLAEYARPGSAVREQEIFEERRDPLVVNWPLRSWTIRQGASRLTKSSLFPRRESRRSQGDHVDGLGRYCATVNEDKIRDVFRRILPVQGPNDTGWKRAIVR